MKYSNYKVKVLLVIICVSLTNCTLNQQDNALSRYKREEAGNAEKGRIRHQDLWTEVNDVIVLNCSLRANKDQHVVWHRKYEKLGVHVLTIESETFISDLRIRPIKQTFISEQSKPLSAENGLNNGLHVYGNEDAKFTWNLEIRRLKKEDSALYYCVINSENSYGQIYKLNVLSQLKSLNGSRIAIDETKKPSTTTLACEYSDVTRGPRNQIRWYYHHYRLNNNLKNFRIIETKDFHRNVTISKLFIDNYKHKDHLGFYRCMFKGLYRRIRVVAKGGRMTASNRLVDNTIFNTAPTNVTSKLLNLITVFITLLTFQRTN